jgi:hypothetical protein
MDIEFIVQDTFALTRPQWKLASNFEEASKAFQLAVAQDQKSAGVDKTAEVDDASVGSSSDDENGDPDLPEVDDETGSEEEDIEVCSDGLIPSTEKQMCTDIGHGVAGGGSATFCKRVRIGR